MAAKPTAKMEPETAEAEPAIGGEVTTGGVTVVPLLGVGKPEMVGTGGLAVGPTGTEVQVGVSTGQEEMVMVTVAGGAGTVGSGTVGAGVVGTGTSVSVGTSGTTGVSVGRGASVVEQGTVMVVSWPIGQSVTVGWQLVIVLTMVV